MGLFDFFKPKPKSNNSKEHKFHFNTSIKGALLYASSLGLNVDQYE